MKEPNILIYFLFPPITQRCSISDVQFTGAKGVSYFSVLKYYELNINWRAPWKNRICSTSMKLRKSLVKPVMRQNISSCSVLSPEIVMHDTFSVSLWTSTDICVVVHDDLGWKNRTTWYILLRHWLYKWFSSAANVRRYMRWAWRSRVKEPNNTFVIGFGKLAAVN